MKREVIDSRIAINRSYLERLVAAPYHHFDSRLRSSLPEDPGIYRICMKSSGETLRAGVTKSSDSLRQRVYQNHFMGNQSGNIRSQLVKAKMCVDLDMAKDFLKNSCSVQWIEIQNNEERTWAEHFMLSIFQPRFSD
jgi:hypothetical protein